MPNSIAVIERTSAPTARASFHIKPREAKALVSSGQCAWAVPDRVLRKTPLYGRLYGQHEADVDIQIVRISANEDNREALYRATKPLEAGRAWLELHVIVEYPLRLGAKRVHEWLETDFGLAKRLKSGVIGPYCDWSLSYARLMAEARQEAAA